MALIQCPECGKDVSDTARSCPHCGYNLACRHQARKRAAVLIGLLIALFVGIAVYAVYEHERNERARELNEQFLNKCPYNTYTEAYQWLNSISSTEDKQGLYWSIRKDEMRGVPFESSEFYLQWPSFRDKYTRR